MKMITTDDNRFILVRHIRGVAFLDGKCEEKKIVFYIDNTLKDVVSFSKEDVTDDEHKEKRYMDYTRGVYEELQNKIFAMRENGEDQIIDIPYLKNKWKKAANKPIEKSD